MLELEENEQQYTGRYTRAFLNSVFGRDAWMVNTFDLSQLKTSEGMRQANAALDDEDLSFAYMSDTKLTCVWLRDYPGWLNFCEPLGIRIKPSPKIAKRLTVMTRTAYLHAKFDIRRVNFNNSPIESMCNIRAVEPHEFTDYEIGDMTTIFGQPHRVDEDDMVKMLDGANVISRELVETMMTNGSRIVEEQFLALCQPDCEIPCKIHGRGNPYDRVYYNTAIDNTSSMSSLRVTTPYGLIKGDTLVAPREAMGGYDILYCTENIKKELITEQFVFALAEPHPAHRKHIFSPNEPAPPPVWTDDQSMSWLGDFLYDPETLKFAMSDFVRKVELDLTENRYPKFFTDVHKLDDQFSSIQQFQSQALLWERYGPGRMERSESDPQHGTSLDQSIFLQERIAQGAINQLTKSKKRRWPVMCAAYVHVATDSWLHMAGFSTAEDHPWPFEKPETPRGCAWLHEETGRLVYNDMDFVELYDRHGGWDLDDSVKVHFRTFNGRKVLVIVRSPNSWGEYDIKDYVEGSYHVTWTTAEGDVIEFPEVGATERKEFLEELDITYQYPNGLSPSEIGAQSDENSLHGEVYTPEMARQAAKTAAKFDGVFGKRANADMVYFHTINDYRREQLAPIEAIVDACTQEQSEKARDLIVDDTEQVKKEIIESGKRADRRLWQQRFILFDSRMRYTNGTWADLTDAHTELCALHQRRLLQIAQRAVERIDPEILELGRLAEHVGEKMVNWFYRLRARLYQHESENKSQFYHRINRGVVSQFSSLPDHKIYSIVLGMARHVYTKPRGNTYKDTPLFQVGEPGEPSVFGYYLDAIEFFGIGDVNWSQVAHCPECGNDRYFTSANRLAFQAMVNRQRCWTC